MKQRLGWMAWAALAGTCLTSAQAPDARRMDRIWAACGSRMARQCDAWFEDGDYPKSVQLLRIRREMFPNDYEIATDLGWLLESMERWDEALAVYSRYRLQNPKDPDRAFPEANLFFQKRQYEKVPPLLEPTIAERPHGNSYRLLAHSYERLGRLSDCIRVWEQYLKVNPNDGPAKANLERVRKKAQA